jgi:hypothetical protein
MGSHETVEVATTYAAITHVWLGSHPLPHDYRLHLRVDESLTPVPPRERRNELSPKGEILADLPVRVESDPRNSPTEPLGPLFIQVVTAHHHAVIFFESLKVVKVDISG